MENLTKQQLQRIINVYDTLNRNMVINNDVNEVYDWLPNKAEVSNPISRVREINRFVILNYNDIMNEINAPDLEVLEVPEVITKTKQTDTNVVVIKMKPKTKKHKKTKINK